MLYKTGYCFTPVEFFENYDCTGKISVPKKTCHETYGSNSKKTFCVKVFLYLWYLILLDIIENNATFVLPVVNCHAMVGVQAVKGEAFKKAYQAGKFAGIDYFESDFTGYKLVYSYKTRKGTLREKDIYINEEMKQRLYSNVNSGKKYY